MKHIKRHQTAPQLKKIMTSTLLFHGSCSMPLFLLTLLVFMYFDAAKLQLFALCHKHIDVDCTKCAFIV